MTVDYQVLQFQDTAQLKEIDVFSRDPYALKITGRDFKAVSAVLINGVRSPEFVVLSSRQILAEVPLVERKSPVTSVAVLLSRHGVTPTSKLSFHSVVPGARATGFNRLVQSFLRLLFTNPGTDIQNPRAGGGLMRLVGATGDIGGLRTQASMAVRKAEEGLVSLQAGNPRLLASERLRSAALLSAEFSTATTTLSLRLRLTAMDGSTYDPLVSV